MRESGRQDSNLRPPAPKAGALAKLSYAPVVTGWMLNRLGQAKNPATADEQTSASLADNAASRATPRIGVIDCYTALLNGTARGDVA